jgi:hypothetical protein
MKKYYKASSGTSRFLLMIGFLLLFFSSAVSQSFYLKDYILGNGYDPTNKSWTWKASKYCPYNYSIKANKVDYWGGEIELHASPGTKPACKSIYKINWTFSKDIRTITCGEKIFIDIKNVPISKSDCGIFVWEGDQNPSSISIKCGSGVGESALVYEIRKNDPMGSYRDYVFSHYPGHIVHGEKPSHVNEYTHQNHARVVLDICSRKDYADIANGGSFTFRIGNRGISFDVVYLYDKNSITVPPEPVSLSNPLFTHNIQNSEGVYWMKIQVPGNWQFQQAGEFQLIIRFIDPEGNFLPGINYDNRYIDSNGYAATGSAIIQVPAGNYDISSQEIWMPYYALNLPKTGIQQTYNINAYAEIFLNGKVVGQSQLVPLTVNW